MTLTPRHTTVESYEVYDDEGNSVGRVVLPKTRRLFGSGEGTVLMQRQPDPRPNRSQSHAA
ncbi:MAG: hypothetical protein ABI647_02770 [Gemmatimonadota bacterium]